MEGYEEDGLDKWPVIRKLYVFGQVKSLLLKEDTYFNEHLEEAVSTSEQWAKFCDNYIELATLDQYLFGNPICLLLSNGHMKKMDRSFRSRVRAEV